MSTPEQPPTAVSTEDFVTPALVAAAEQAEAEFMLQTEDLAPADVKEWLGITTTRLGGGVVLSARQDPTRYWSKALGFGVDEPVTDELIGRILEFYRSQRNPFAVLQIAPSLLPADWADIAARHHLQPGSPWVKTACRIDQAQPAPEPAGLRVGLVEEADAKTWATVVNRGFGMPEELDEMLAGAWHHPSLRPYAAWDGDTLVAGGTLFVHGKIGSVHADATLPSHRNRGAQLALMAARAEAAKAAGCEWLCSETGKPAPGTSNPSLNNMLRIGFKPLYERQNWLWSASS